MHQKGTDMVGELLGAVIVVATVADGALGSRGRLIAAARRARALRSSSSGRVRVLGLVLTVAGALSLPALASAADKVYWGNFGGNSIGWEYLDGSAGGYLSTTGATDQSPWGEAIDSATGKIYWANEAGSISWANLDGSGGGDLNTAGATPQAPSGVAVDPATGKIYYADALGNSILWANLDGSGGGHLSTGTATVNEPEGVAVDPAAGKIYWANHVGNKISWANLDGSAGGDLSTGSATVSTPTGVAVDPAAGKIYWANVTANKISWANLDGSAGGDLSFTAASSLGFTLNGPAGLAIDPVSGQIWWASYHGNAISYAHLDGSGAADLVDNFPSSPQFPVLSRAPMGTGNPVISGGSLVGSQLSCSPGSWAADVVSAFFYRAPRSYSYQWARNGSAVSGATASTYTPGVAGSYTCQVTASNEAGSASQTSSAVRITIPPADSVYWANFGANVISLAHLDGSGGTDLSATGATLNSPYGMAVDLAAGKIYWANYSGNVISWANLDGSGGGNLITGAATVNHPVGVAVDPAAGKIYWANEYAGISWAKLDGSGGGDLGTAGATVDGPKGVAVDTAAGKIYWANAYDSTIAWANLDGSGGGNVNTGAAAVNLPVGVAVDPSAGKIYWANQNAGISWAKLDGSGGGNLTTTGATVAYPTGVAVDPVAGKIYWASLASGTISWAKLDGSGGGDVSTAGATTDQPEFPVLVRAPVGAGAPVISGGHSAGSSVSCSLGSWAADVVSDFFYRSPHSYAYQWARNGSNIPGARSSTYTANLAGAYTCRVTASNPAGTATQLSAKQLIQASITKVSPNAGPLAGGGTVTIFGSGFAPDMSVSFGSHIASNVTVISATKVTAVAPAGTAGFVHVRVGTPGDWSSLSNGDLYAYGPPQVKSVSPNAGPLAGGGTVTITGSGFVPGVKVVFGALASSSVTFVSPTRLTAVAPAASAAGSVHVRVANADGPSPTTNADLYTYQ